MPTLAEQFDPRQPIKQLAEAMPRAEFEAAFGKYYSLEGRLAKPVRLMAGLLLLKQMFNQGDAPALEQTQAVTGQTSSRTIVGRGYRGRKTVNQTEVLVPGKAKAGQSKYASAKMRARFGFKSSGPRLFRWNLILFGSVRKMVFQERLVKVTWIAWSIKARLGKEWLAEP